MKISKELDGKIRRFCAKNNLGVLATCSTKNDLLASALYYYFDEKFNLFCVTKVDTSKFKNIKKNPNVAFAVADEPAQLTLQLQGSAAVIKSGTKDFEKALSSIASMANDASGVWTPVIAKLQRGNYVVMKIKPKFLRFADYTQSKEENIFTQVV